MTKMQN